MLSLEERPFSYNDMIGQKVILREMKNRSKDIDFAQVMFFEGPTGTGKTTMACITAALINCRNPIDREDYKDPCGECRSCRTVLDDSFHRDIHLHDASQMKKEDVLNLERTAGISSMFDKNKVMIIDEAQELSKAGKGATLRLLEKKRKKVYFILNTMNKQSFDKAIVTRGPCYTFKDVHNASIASYLKGIVNKHKYDVPQSFIEEGISIIAKRANGSVREALQSLERCIYGEIYTKEEIQKEFGYIEDKDMLDLISQLIKKQPEFFDSLAAVNKSSFYYYSHKILLDIVKFKITERASKWQESFFKDLISEDGSLVDLLKVYSQIPSRFNESIFENLLMQYYLIKKRLPVK